MSTNHTKETFVNSSKTAYILLYLLFMITGIILCFHHYIGYDEAYSMCLVRHSFSDIIRITAADVHPPLYYLLLKIWLLPFGSSVFAARIFSLLIHAFFISLGPLLVRKLFSPNAGLLFAFFAVTLPACQSYLYSEIRMYGLAALLVTICALSAYAIADGGDSALRCPWILLFLSGISGAYTQYYALIAVALIYIALFAGILYRKELRTKGLPLLICVLGSCLLYAPWLVVLLRQFSVVSESYWIGAFTLHTYLSFAAFPFYCGIHTAASFFYIALSAVLVTLIFRKKAASLIKRKHSPGGSRNRRPSVVLFFLFPYIMVIVTGCAVSLFIRPLFSARYIKCILGLLIVCLSVILSDTQRSVPKKLLFLFCSVFALTNFFVMYRKNTANNSAVSAYVHFLDSINDEPVFAAKQSHLMGIHAFYADGTEYLPSKNYTADLEAFSPVLHPVSNNPGKNTDCFWVISEEDFQMLCEERFLSGAVLDPGPEFFFSDQTETYSIRYIRISP